MDLNENKIELTTQLNEEYDIDKVNTQLSEDQSVFSLQFYQIKFLNTLARYGNNWEEVIKNMPDLNIDTV